MAEEKHILEIAADGIAKAKEQGVSWDWEDFKAVHDLIENSDE